MDGDEQFLTIERSKVARHPVADGTIALKQRGGGGHRVALEKILAGEAVFAAPVDVRIGDVTECVGGDALRSCEGVGRGSGVCLADSKIRRFTETGDRDQETQQPGGAEDDCQNSHACGKRPVFHDGASGLRGGQPRFIKRGRLLAVGEAGFRFESATPPIRDQSE